MFNCRLILLIFWYPVFISAQANSPLLDSIINTHPNLKNVTDHRQKYQPQIIFTQINRDADNRPSFVNHTYFLDAKNYFYCASLVKLPCSIFALEKINQLNHARVSRISPMLTDSAGPCQKKCWSDTSSQNGWPSVEHYIKKMLLVSDNVSYSRIFEFLNPKYINTRLTELGYPDARIVHRLSAECAGPPNLFMNPVRFLDEKNELSYAQPADTVKIPFAMPFTNLVVGRDIYNKRKRLVSSKKDFSQSNYLSLETVHSILKDLVFMDYVPVEKRYKLTGDDRDFLLRHMAMYPRESAYPNYQAKTFFDSFKKYFIYGNTVEKITQDSVRIFNIVGRAYGYLIDCAYIVNYSTKTEFMLSAVTYNNQRNSFGTGNYEYTTIGLPFFKELSLALYALESSRKKKYLPDLESINYFKSQ